MCDMPRHEYAQLLAVEAVASRRMVVMVMEASIEAPSAVLSTTPLAQ